MPTGLTQKLYLGGVPDGLTFELSSIRPSAPNDGYDWKGEFRQTAGGLSVSIIGQTVYYNWPLPSTVSTSDWDGLIGEAHFEGHNGLWSSGEGAKVAIDIRLYGRATINDETVNLDESGTIVVSTTDWKGFARPDYVNTTYSWKRSTADPVNVALGVPSNMAGMPSDLFFVYAASPQDQKVGTVTTTNKAIISTVMDYALKGIFWVNEKLFKWAFGPF